jgi:hypothetical protein
MMRRSFLRSAAVLTASEVTARIQEGSARGLNLAAQSGHNDEFHNHNDVANFVAFASGQPAIIDVRVETYSDNEKTFSPQRYEIWTMQSAYHNLPTVNSVMQAAGRQYAARDVSYSSSDAAAEFSLDIAGAYPAEAGLESWKRTLRLDRFRNQIEIRERYLLRRAGGRVALTLMTPCVVRVEGGRIGLADRAAVLYEAAALSPRVEEIGMRACVACGANGCTGSCSRRSASRRAASST